MWGGERLAGWGEAGEKAQGFCVCGREVRISAPNKMLQRSTATDNVVRDERTDGIKHQGPLHTLAFNIQIQQKTNTLNRRPCSSRTRTNTPRETPPLMVAGCGRWRREGAPETPPLAGFPNRTIGRPSRRYLIDLLYHEHGICLSTQLTRYYCRSNSTNVKEEIHKNVAAV